MSGSQQSTHSLIPLAKGKCYSQYNDRHTETLLAPTHSYASHYCYTLQLQAFISQPAAGGIGWVMTRFLSVLHPKKCWIHGISWWYQAAFSAPPQQHPNRSSYFSLNSSWIYLINSNNRLSSHPFTFEQLLAVISPWPLTTRSLFPQLLSLSLHPPPLKSLQQQQFWKAIRSGFPWESSTMTLTFLSTLHCSAVSYLKRGHVEHTLRGSVLEKNDNQIHFSPPHFTST